MEITSATYVGSYVDWEACPPPNKPEYAFIGRSNVGKSSLINLLTARKGLAKISGSPGKTQTINAFLINEAWYLTDLPGYGFAQRSQAQREGWRKMITRYLRHRRNLVNVFLLIDSRLEPQKIDLAFVRDLGSWEVPFCLVFTKTDKNRQSETSRHVKAFLDKMREEWEYLPPHFLSSSVKRTGREEILAFIEDHNLRFGAIAAS